MQNNTLNDIFHVFQELISSTEISYEKINKENYEDVSNKVKSKIGDYLKDGTYDLISGQEEKFDTGFHVDL